MSDIGVVCTVEPVIFVYCYCGSAYTVNMFGSIVLYLKGFSISFCQVSVQLPALLCACISIKFGF